MNTFSNTQSSETAGSASVAGVSRTGSLVHAGHSARAAAKPKSAKPLGLKPLGLLLVALLSLLGLLAAACGGGSASSGAQVATEGDTDQAETELDVSPAVAVAVSSTEPETAADPEAGSDDAGSDDEADGAESADDADGSEGKQKSEDDKPWGLRHKFRQGKNFGAGSFAFKLGDLEDLDKDWDKAKWGDKNWHDFDWDKMHDRDGKRGCVKRYRLSQQQGDADTDSDAETDTAGDIEPDAQNVAALLAELTGIFPELSEAQAEALATAYDLCGVEITAVNAILAHERLGAPYRQFVTSLTAENYRNFVDAARQQACDLLSLGLEDLPASLQELREFDWSEFNPVLLAVSVNLAAQMLFQPTEAELQAIEDDLLEELKESLEAAWKLGIDALESGEVEEDYTIMGCDVNLGFIGGALNNFTGLGKELGKALGEGLGKSLGERFKRFDGSKLPDLDGFKLPKPDDLEERLGSLGENLGELMDNLLDDLGDLDRWWQDDDDSDTDSDSETDVELI